MYVVGATQASYLKKIREYVPEHFLLVPAIGAQGGSLQEVAKYGLTKKCGLIVNNSRAIIFAIREKKYAGWDEERFAEAAAIEAGEIQSQMKEILIQNGIVKY
jgi:orotidine-5'-phosphate decarboxylase